MWRSDAGSVCGPKRLGFRDAHKRVDRDIEGFREPAELRPRGVAVPPLDRAQVGGVHLGVARKGFDAEASREAQTPDRTAKLGMSGVDVHRGECRALRERRDPSCVRQMTWLTIWTMRHAARVANTHPSLLLCMRPAL